MPRIPGVHPTEAGPLVRLTYRYARRRFGRVPEPVTVAAHHRGVFVTTAVHELSAERGLRRLPAVLRELVTLRVATVVGCSWCVDFGTMLSLREGMDADRLAQLHRHADSDVFTAVEKRALAYADAVTDQPMTVTDAQVAALRDDLGDDGLVELTYLVALENSRSRFNGALGITAQGFTSGDRCPVPVTPDSVSAGRG